MGPTSIMELWTAVAVICQMASHKRMIRVFFHLFMNVIESFIWKLSADGSWIQVEQNT